MKKNFQKFILEEIDRLSKIVLLNRHLFSAKKGTENPEALAECVFNYPYLNVTINYNEKLEKRWLEGEDVTEYILHELCHVITDPLYAKAVSRYTTKNDMEDERERLTDFISHIVLKNIPLCRPKPKSSTRKSVPISKRRTKRG